MTATTDFMLKLRRIDDMKVIARDVLILWACRAKPGMMGMELALSLGYASRSVVQTRIRILCEMGLLDDRRKIRGPKTPNDLHITAAGSKFLDELLA